MKGTTNGFIVCISKIQHRPV